MVVSAPRPKPPVNPRHRKQVAWQILMPLVVSGILILAVAVITALLAGSHPAETSAWSSVSLVLLLIPVIFGFGISIILVLAGIFLLAKSLNILPFYTRMIYLYLSRLEINIQVLSDRLTSPVLTSRSWFAGWKMFWNRLRIRKSDDKEK